MRWISASRLILIAILTIAARAPPFTGVVKSSALARQATAEVLPATTEVTSALPSGVHLEALITIGIGDTGGEVDLLTHPVDAGVTTLHTYPHPVPLGLEQFEVALDLDFRADFVPAGVQLEAIWQMTRPDGSIRTPNPFRPWWLDGRRDWTTLSAATVTVHAFNSYPETVQAVHDSAQITSDDLCRSFGFDTGPTINVWVYPRYDALAAITVDNSREFIAGLSYPEYSAIGVVIPDDQSSELARVNPHEVSHQVLYRATSSPFSFVPLWFDDGLAKNVQTGGTDGLRGMVRAALAEGRLFELSSILVAFPFNVQGATLAFATSHSEVAYIQERWGDVGLQDLIQGFAEGNSLEWAIRYAVGQSLNELDDDWKAWITTGPREPPSISQLQIFTRSQLEPGSIVRRSHGMYWTKKHVLVCTASHCSQKGGMDVAGRLRLAIIRAGLDTEILVNNCGTIDLCDIGPNIVVYPDNVIYRGIIVKDIPEIIEHLKGGAVVERLLLTDRSPEEVNRRNVYADLVARGTVTPEDAVELVAGYDLGPDWISEQQRRGFMAKKPDDTGIERINATKKARARYSV